MDNISPSQTHFSLVNQNFYICFGNSMEGQIFQPISEALSPQRRKLKDWVDLPFNQGDDFRRNLKCPPYVSFKYFGYLPPPPGNLEIPGSGEKNLGKCPGGRANFFGKFSRVGNKMRKCFQLKVIFLYVLVYRVFFRKSPGESISANSMGWGKLSRQSVGGGGRFPSDLNDTLHRSSIQYGVPESKTSQSTADVSKAPSGSQSYYIRYP